MRADDDGKRRVQWRQETEPEIEGVPEPGGAGGDRGDGRVAYMEVLVPNVVLAVQDGYRVDIAVGGV